MAFQNIHANPYSDFISKAMYSRGFWWEMFRYLRKIIFFKNYDARAFKLVSSKDLHQLDKKKAVLHFKDYWMDAKYLLKMESLVRKTFQFKTVGIIEKNKLILDKIRRGGSVSIHVRRGDYLIDPYLLQFCQGDYYKQAINRIKKECKSPHFYIFSDDIAWCKNAFDDLPQKTFVDWNNNEKSHLDMLLMANCEHNIAAASTFSWWAAWLNKNKSKMVIMPKNWLVFEGHEKELFKNCIRI